MNLVALMVVVSLAVSGVVTPGEPAAGFGESLVIMIAALAMIVSTAFLTPIASPANTLARPR